MPATPEVLTILTVLCLVIGLSLVLIGIAACRRPAVPPTPGFAIDKKLLRKYVGTQSRWGESQFK